MKTHKNYLAILVALIAIITSVSFEVQANKLNKTFQKEFSADKGTLLRIDNRFGQVSIENWDKNSISIEVEVNVEHSSKDKAERMLAAINITLDQKGNEVIGLTEIDEKVLKSATNFNFGSSSKEIRIDYKVKMPKHIDANLKNKFGDIFIAELTGHTTIELKYGNLKANRIVYGSSNPLSMLTLGYGNASIEEVDWMRFDVKYSNVDVTKGKALVILSKYSKISVDDASSIVVDSKYDTYTIGTISNIVGDSGYTTYRISKLEKKLDVTTKYGDVKVGEVLPNFESISFRGSYSSLQAPIPDNASYRIKGSASYGGITYNSTARVNRIDTNNNLTVDGIVGENQNATSVVEVSVRYGNARLR